MSWSCVFTILYLAGVSARDLLPWWKTATFYEVFPRSFKDSDGDGIGDLRGILEKAEYFKELGVDAIWLTPIFKSPMVDFGYDISSFSEIERIFGTMDDFEALLAKLRGLGVKLVLDFVPNHTSDQHVWFQYSVNTSHPLHKYYKDFYVWHDGNRTKGDGKPNLPNNWLSVFGGPAWTWSEERQQFYLHQFSPSQPDLNFRNPMVVGNVTDIMYFWLDKGIDGFRIDAADHLFEDANFTDEKPYPGKTGENWFTVNHTSMTNQPETFQQLRVWADLLHLRGVEDGKELVMFLEIYAPLHVSMEYYGTGNQSLEIPFNFWFLIIGNPYTKASDLKSIIDMWMSSMPKDSAPNWVIGNHDSKRLPNMYGTEMVDGINLLSGVLPGVKVTYYGEEIGMESTAIPFNEIVDPVAKNLGPSLYELWCRDFGRTPMQWDDSPNAGFSSNSSTWLPVNPNFWHLNVASQMSASKSHLKVFQAMTKARKDPVLQRGSLQVIIPSNNNNTLVIVRSYNGSHFILLMNLCSYPASYTSQNFFTPQGLDQDMTVVVGGINSGYMPGVNFQNGSYNITLRPKAAILLKSGRSNSSTSEGFILLSSVFICMVPIIIVMSYHMF